jgi:hypothetical protein
VVPAHAYPDRNNPNLIQKADQPDIVVHFFDVDRLAGKDGADVDSLVFQTNASAIGDHDHFVVKRIVDQAIREGARGGLIDLRRTLHGKGFVRRLVIEYLDEIIEAGLLLQEVAGGRFGDFFLQGQMHAFGTAVLLRMATLDPFDANAQAQATRQACSTGTGRVPMRSARRCRCER